MSHAGRVVEAARWRIVARSLLAGLGRWLIAGAACATGAALLGKALGAGWPAWLTVGVPLTAAATLGLAREAFRGTSRLRAAIEVDQALGLRDRLSSALALDEASKSDVFSRLAVEDAERAANGVEARRAVRVADGLRGWPWRVWPGLALVAVASWAWLPEAGAAAREREWLAAAQQAERREHIATEVRTAVEAARADPIVRGSVDPRIERELDALAELEDLLASGREGKPEDAARRAAESMSALAEHELERAAESRDRADALARTLAGLSHDQGESAPISEAVRSADLERAAAEAEQAAARLAGMSAEERNVLADQLRKLADDLERLLPTQAPEADPGARDATEGEKGEAPEGAVDEAVPPTAGAKEEPSGPNRDETKDSERNSVSEEIARPNDGKESGAEEQAVRDLRELTRRAREAAEKLDEQSSSRESAPDSSTPSGQEPEQTRGDRLAERSAERGTSQEGGAPQPTRERPEGAPSESSAEGARDQQPTAPRTAPDESGSPSPKEERESLTEGAEPGRTGALPEPRESQQPADQPDKRTGSETSPSRDGEPTGERSDSETSSEQQAMEGLAEKLKEMSRPSRESREQERSSRDWRERARRMLEGMSPDDRRQLEELARQSGRPDGSADGGIEPSSSESSRSVRRDEGSGADAHSTVGSDPGPGGGPGGRGGASAAAGRDSGPPVRVDPVDASNPADRSAQSSPQRVAAEWFNPEGEVDRRAVSRREVDALIRDAAKGAEKAIEDRAVPSRYDRLLRQYFRRLPERAVQESAPATDSGSNPGP